MGNLLLLLAILDAIRWKCAVHRHPFDTDSPFLRVSPSTSLRILPSILPRIPPPKMSYAAFAPARAYTYAAPASPNAFALFASPQSPRDTYHTYEDARLVLRPSNGRVAAPKKTSALKKLFGM
ncbi:hypothetical protein C2E23DRAFT_906801 [Lenzites betulinus]|nr:hypothetical protein C2E23DRAFT_906801 [Lenzites betulinus]